VTLLVQCHPCKAHELNLKVILGMVPNHTSRDNVWTQSNPDYYVQAEDGRPTFDLDWSDTAKLDYTNPGLRTAMKEVYAYWLDVLDGDGVDGFRIDMAHFINDPSFWDEALPQLKAAHPHRDLLFMAECYGIDNNLQLFKRGMNAAYDDDLYKVCEIFYGKDTQGETQIRKTPTKEDLERFPEHWEVFKRGGIRAAAERVIQTYAEALPGLPQPCSLARYTDNHDEGRGLYRFGPGAVRAFNTLIFSLPHTIPFLLTGQEFGALNRPSIHERASVCDKGYHFFDGAKWTRREGVEFEGNIFDRGRERRNAWFSFFRDLIQRRASIPAMRDGTIEILDAQEDAQAADQSVVALRMSRDEKSCVVIVNLGPAPRKLKNEDILRGHQIAGQLDDQGALPAFGSLCIEQ